MAISKREIINGLKEEHKELRGRIHQVEIALRAFGCGAAGHDVQPSRVKTNGRVHAPRDTERELIRVLTESREALSAAQIHERGMFTGTPSSVYHAAKRLPDQVNAIKVGTHRLFALKEGTATEMRIRVGEGEIKS